MALVAHVILWLTTIIVIANFLKSIELYGQGFTIKEIITMWNHYLLYSGMKREELYEKNYIQETK
jgi:hypothetical protein